MTIRFSENWVGRTVDAVVHGTNFNNALGGGGTTAIERTSASHYVSASATSGFLKAGNPASSFIGGVAGNAGVFDGKIRMLVDISAGRNAVRLKGAGDTAPNGIQVTLNATHTSLQLSGGNGTPAKTIAAPAGNFWLELEILDLTMTARVFNASDMSLHDSFSGVLLGGQSGRSRGPYWSGLYGAASTPINSLLGSIIMDDMATGAAPPTISSVTAAKNGKYAATGSITATGTDGRVYYKWYPAAGTPTIADVMGTGTAADWTTAGAFPVSVAGLFAGTSYKLAAVRRDAGLNISTLVVSSTFTTDAPLPAPTGTTTRTVSGQAVQVLYTPGPQQVDSVSVSLPPASSSPGGAVTQGPVLATFDSGLGKWVASFSGVPAGTYGDPVTLASNADNASISITGATGFSIVGIDGQPTAPDVVPPVDTEAPQMQGTVSLSGLTPTSYTTGCDAASDNVGVVGYQVSLDGGANWIEKNTSRTHNATGRTPGSTDAVWWRAYDAVPNYADPITRSVTLASVPAPVITTQPGNATVVEGAGTNLTAAATVSTGTLSWQWFSRPAGDTGSGTAVSAATAATLATGNLTLAQNGIQYRARARNTISGQTADAFTNWATVAVTSSVVAPTITDDADDTTVTEGQTAAFSVAASSGGGTLAYAWFSRPSGNGGAGTAISGAASASLTTAALALADNGRQYRARVTNSAGEVFSRWATATVQAATVLPPGPGDVLAGISPPALFQLLAAAGES